MMYEAIKSPIESKHFNRGLRAAPKMASVVEWYTTSPSEWATTPKSKSFKRSKHEYTRMNMSLNTTYIYIYTYAI